MTYELNRRDFMKQTGALGVTLFFPKNSSFKEQFQQDVRVIYRNKGHNEVKGLGNSENATIYLEAPRNVRFKLGDKSQAGTWTLYNPNKHKGVDESELRRDPSNGMRYIFDDEISIQVLNHDEKTLCSTNLIRNPVDGNYYNRMLAEKHYPDGQISKWEELDPALYTEEIIDGKKIEFDKRGYVIAMHESLPDFVVARNIPEQYKAHGSCTDLETPNMMSRLPGRSLLKVSREIKSRDLHIGDGHKITLFTKPVIIENNSTSSKVDLKLRGVWKKYLSMGSQASLEKEGQLESKLIE